MFLFVFSVSCSEHETREVILFEKGIADGNASATSIASGGSVTFTDLSTKVHTREWTFPNGTPATSTDQEVTVVFNNGSFNDILNVDAKLTITHVDNTTSEKVFNIEVDPVESLPDAIPYGGVPVAIPGTVEAENYDQGGQGTAYNDNEEENLGASYSEVYRTDDGVDIEGGEGSFNIGYTNEGEWIHYTLEVAATNFYDFEFLVASGGDSGGKSILIDHVAAQTGALTPLGETGDFPNTGGWGSYVPLKVEGIRLNEGINTIRLSFTGGSTNVDKVNISPSSSGGDIDYTIAFASDDIEGSDAGYITLLQDAGYTVVGANGEFNNLDASGVSALNGYDLVIISRNTNSGNFGSDEAVRANWMQVSTPVINTSAFITRNTRLQQVNSGEFVEGVNSTYAVDQTSHPIFTGIDISSGQTGNITDSGSADITATADVGTGIKIASDVNSGNIAIAEWAAGKEAYSGSGVPTGKRMFLGVNSGAYELSQIGQKLYINAVEYMITGDVIDGGNTP